MNSIVSFLDGKKTYITAIIIAGLAFAQALGYQVPDYVFPLLGAAGLGTLRVAVSKV
jgi:hypothetical protein